MEKSNLKPFLRTNIEILFVGLNPATGSSRNQHYFSVNQSFWNQLYLSGLISRKIDKSFADHFVFGSNMINYNGWNYGITDLVTELAESDSSRIEPTKGDCKKLKNNILRFKPKTVVFLHGKVLKTFLKYIGKPLPKSNSGELGKLIKSVDTNFFNIAFPHGNTIPHESKVNRYRELKTYIENTINK